MSQSQRSQKHYDDDVSVARANIKQVTNRRQARKIMDVTTPEVLYLSWECGRELWITNTDAGLYAVGYGTGGGMTLCRIVPPGYPALAAQSADSDDVRNKYRDDDNVPDAVRYPKVGDS